MPDALELWEKPAADEIVMIAGWRQWADAGTVSSGLPEYLIEQTTAHPIGKIRPDGFYLFQVPGTHDLVRPVVEFVDGYPEKLEKQRNEIYFTEQDGKGLVIFLGDEPHMDVERYVDTFLQAASELNVRRAVAFGGVYGEVPYEKERTISCVYSQRGMKDELAKLAVSFSDYHGGASIDSMICRQAANLGQEYIGLYAFVPTYDFSVLGQIDNAFRIETDYLAWVGMMRRVNYLLGLNIDLNDLDERGQRLIDVVNEKVNEIEDANPGIGISDYLKKLSEEFDENSFNPLDEVWEDELKRLFDKLDDEEEG